MGETVTVRGTLGPGRSLKSGVAYALTDDSGAIDLILWNSLVPADVLGVLEEGATVAAVGTVDEYDGTLQIKAARGHSVMVIP